MNIKFTLNSSLQNTAHNFPADFAKGDNIASCIDTVQFLQVFSLPEWTFRHPIGHFAT